MAHTWVDGEVITAEKLNSNIFDGYNVSVNKAYFAQSQQLIPQHSVSEPEVILNYQFDTFDAELLDQYYQNGIRNGYKVKIDDTVYDCSAGYSRFAYLYCENPYFTIKGTVLGDYDSPFLSDENHTIEIWYEEESVTISDDFEKAVNKSLGNNVFVIKDLMLISDLEEFFENNVGKQLYVLDSDIGSTPLPMIGVVEDTPSFAYLYVDMGGHLLVMYTVEPDPTKERPVYLTRGFYNVFDPNSNS